MDRSLTGVAEPYGHYCGTGVSRAPLMPTPATDPAAGFVPPATGSTGGQSAAVGSENGGGPERVGQAVVGAVPLMSAMNAMRETFSDVAVYQSMLTVCSYIDAQNRELRETHAAVRQEANDLRSEVERLRIETARKDEQIQHLGQQRILQNVMLTIGSLVGGVAAGVAANDYYVTGFGDQGGPVSLGILMLSLLLMVFGWLPAGTRK